MVVVNVIFELLLSYLEIFLWMIEQCRSIYFSICLQQLRCIQVYARLNQLYNTFIQTLQCRFLITFQNTTTCDTKIHLLWLFI